MQQWIMEAFGREGLETCDPPNVSVNAHSGDPHYEPTSATSAPIRQGDFVLLDIWAKRKRAQTPSITTSPGRGRWARPATSSARFSRSCAARAMPAFSTVQEAFDAKKKICGWEVDKATREYIDGKGLGQILHPSHRALHHQRHSR